MPESEIPQRVASREELYREIQDVRIGTAVLLAEVAIDMVESDRLCEELLRRVEDSREKHDEAIAVLKRAFAIRD